MPITSLDAFQSGAPWPPDGETERLTRWRKNRALFDGDHFTAYGLINRQIRPELSGVRLFVLNFQKRLSVHWADMLFGERPQFSAPTEEAQAALADLVKRNDLHNVGHEAAIDVSRYGTGVLKVRLRDGKAVIEAQQPDYWFPVVSMDNVRDMTAHVLAWCITIRKQHFLRLEIHERGRITHRLHRLGTTKIGAEDKATFAALYPGVPETEDTGVPDFLVIPVFNLRTTGDTYGRDDYSDLDTIVLELEARVAQMSRILDKHADPGMYGPSNALTFNEQTQQYEFKSGTYLPLEGDDIPPGYIAWDGKLEASLAQLNTLIDQLYVLAETSPAAFGQIKAGLAESGSALKRLLMADLTKTNRLRAAFDPALKRAVTLAAQLQAAKGTPTPDLSEVGITWQDGIPVDETEQSANLKAQREAGLLSVEAGVRALHPDWSDDQVAEEVERIKADKPPAPPPTQPPPESPPSEPA